MKLEEMVSTIVRTRAEASPTLKRALAMLGWQKFRFTSCYFLNATSSVMYIWVA